MSQKNRVKRQLRKAVLTDPATGKLVGPRMMPPRGRPTKEASVIIGRARVVNRINPNAPESVRRGSRSALAGNLFGAPERRVRVSGAVFDMLPLFLPMALFARGQKRRVTGKEKLVA